MEKLENKVAIVTGSDSGMGQAMAIEFAKEGADVVVNYLHDEQGAEETKRQIEAEGRHAIIIQADLREEANVARLFKEAEEQLGTPYLLVNNAGEDSTGDFVAEMKIEDWDLTTGTKVD